MPLVAATQDLQLTSVLVATDFSEASRKALRHALAIARHYGAKLYLAHVVSSLGFTLAGTDAASCATDAYLRDVRQLEDDLVRSGALAGIPHEVVVSHGDVAYELEQIVRREHIELVVVGTHARHGVGKLLLGSVAEHIFRHSDCLVVTVGPGCLPDSPVGAPRPVRPFVFATDFSEASLAALPYAVSFANQFRAQLALVHVGPDVPMEEGFHWYSAGDLARLRERTREASLLRLESLVARSSLAAAPEFHVEFGRPSERILDVSRALRADGIVLGLNRSRRAESTAQMPWSTAYDVACGACCSVLTVRS